MRVRLIAAAAVVLLYGASAEAVPITYNFAARINLVEGPLLSLYPSIADGLDVGDIITGSFVYDPGVTYLGPLTTPVWPFVEYHSAIYDRPLPFNFAFGSTHISVPQGITLVVDNYFFQPLGDYLSLAAPVVSVPDIMPDETYTLGTGITFHDMAGDVLSSLSLPDALDLTSLGESRFYMVGADQAGQFLWIAQGSLTSLSPASIPEPAALWIVGLGIAGIGAVRRIKAH